MRHLRQEQAPAIPGRSGNWASVSPKPSSSWVPARLSEAVSFGNQQPPMGMVPATHLPAPPPPPFLWTSQPSSPSFARRPAPPPPPPATQLQPSKGSYKKTLPEKLTPVTPAQRRVISPPFLQLVTPSAMPHGAMPEKTVPARGLTVESRILMATSTVVRSDNISERPPNCFNEMPPMGGTTGRRNSSVAEESEMQAAPRKHVRIDPSREADDPPSQKFSSRRWSGIAEPTQPKFRRLCRCATSATEILEQNIGRDATEAVLQEAPGDLLQPDTECYFGPLYTDARGVPSTADIVGYPQPSSYGVKQHQKPTVIAVDETGPSRMEVLTDKSSVTSSEDEDNHAKASCHAAPLEIDDIANSTDLAAKLLKGILTPAANSKINPAIRSPAPSLYRQIVEKVSDCRVSDGLSENVSGTQGEETSFRNPGILLGSGGAGPLPFKFLSQTAEDPHQWNGPGMDLMNGTAGKGSRTQCREPLLAFGGVAWSPQAKTAQRPGIGQRSDPGSWTTDAKAYSPVTTPPSTKLSSDASIEASTQKATGQPQNRDGIRVSDTDSLLGESESPFLADPPLFPGGTYIPPADTPARHKQPSDAEGLKQSLPNAAALSNRQSHNVYVTDREEGALTDNATPPRSPDQFKTGGDGNSGVATETPCVQARPPNRRTRKRRRKAQGQQPIQRQDLASSSNSAQIAHLIKGLPPLIDPATETDLYGSDAVQTKTARKRHRGRRARSNRSSRFQAATVKAGVSNSALPGSVNNLKTTATIRTAFSNAFPAGHYSSAPPTGETELKMRLPAQVCPVQSAQSPACLLAGAAIGRKAGGTEAWTTDFSSEQVRSFPTFHITAAPSHNPFPGDMILGSLGDATAPASIPPNFLSQSLLGPGPVTPVACGQADRITGAATAEVTKRGAPSRIVGTITVTEPVGAHPGRTDHDCSSPTALPITTPVSHRPAICTEQAAACPYILANDITSIGIGATGVARSKSRGKEKKRRPDTIFAGDEDGKRQAQERVIDLIGPDDQDGKKSRVEVASEEFVPGAITELHLQLQRLGMGHSSTKSDQAHSGSPHTRQNLKEEDIAGPQGSRKRKSKGRKKGSKRTKNRKNNGKREDDPVGATGPVAAAASSRASCETASVVKMTATSIGSQKRANELGPTAIIRPSGLSENVVWFQSEFPASPRRGDQQHESLGFSDQRLSHSDQDSVSIRTTCTSMCSKRSGPSHRCWIHSPQCEAATIHAAADWPPLPALFKPLSAVRSRLIHPTSSLEVYQSTPLPPPPSPISCQEAPEPCGFQPSSSQSCHVPLLRDRGYTAKIGDADQSHSREVVITGCTITRVSHTSSPGVGQEQVRGLVQTLGQWPLIQPARNPGADLWLRCARACLAMRHLQVPDVIRKQLSPLLAKLEEIDFCVEQIRPDLTTNTTLMNMDKSLKPPYRATAAADELSGLGSHVRRLAAAETYANQAGSVVKELVNCSNNDTDGMLPPTCNLQSSADPAFCSLNSGISQPEESVGQPLLAAAAAEATAAVAG